MAVFTVEDRDTTVVGPLLARYRAVRDDSLRLVGPLSPEEWRVQPVPEVSPPWWVLGHTTWFFAKNILEPQYMFGSLDRDYEYALNSYYKVHGAHVPRQSRGCLTRPTNDQILEYRRSVDARIADLLEHITESRLREVAPVMEVGLQHEQQHQELMLTEIKSIRSQNPPAFREVYVATAGRQSQNGHHQPLAWIPFDVAGVHTFGNATGEWGWDIERPVHKRYLQPFRLANRLATNGEFLAFMEDGGYTNPLLWLADGWDHVRAEGWEAPLYWEKEGGQWRHWTLQGMRPPERDEPVTHVSFYEADAFARWMGESLPALSNARLPTEFEWEFAANVTPRSDTENFREHGSLHPEFARASRAGTVAQLFGDVWEWTSSHFEAYPGYRSYLGALGEYNGKFMNNQRVLRGGSCVTPRDHIRPSYRNFWAPATRFQFTGIRLAIDLEGDGT